MSQARTARSALGQLGCSAGGSAGEPPVSGVVARANHNPTSWSHALPVGEWQHVAIVNDGKRSVVWVDGSMIVRNPTSHQRSSPDIDRTIEIYRYLLALATSHGDGRLAFTSFSGTGCDPWADQHGREPIPASSYAQTLADHNDIPARRQATWRNPIDAREDARWYAMRQEKHRFPPDAGAAVGPAPAIRWCGSTCER